MNKIILEFLFVTFSQVSLEGFLECLWVRLLGITVIQIILRVVGKYFIVKLIYFIIFPSFKS